jgi:hypothetical protein
MICRVCHEMVFPPPPKAGAVAGLVGSPEAALIHFLADAEAMRVHAFGAHKELLGQYNGLVDLSIKYLASLFGASAGPAYAATQGIVLATIISGYSLAEIQHTAAPAAVAVPGGVNGSH